jgi:hypothetical protein
MVVIYHADVHSMFQELPPTLPSHSLPPSVALVQAEPGVEAVWLHQALVFLRAFLDDAGNAATLAFSLGPGFSSAESACVPVACTQLKTSGDQPMIADECMFDFKVDDASFAMPTQISKAPPLHSVFVDGSMLFRITSTRPYAIKPSSNKGIASADAGAFAVTLHDVAFLDVARRTLEMEVEARTLPGCARSAHFLLAASSLTLTEIRTLRVWSRSDKVSDQN